MVCSVGSGRMAVMARLLDTGSYSHTLAGELGYENLASRDMERGLCETNEANLVDEEYMHVFGLEPMSDPLHLVCCNACKKPIKASQYTAHAELCQLQPIEASSLELNVARAPKKPPRKERKKPTVAHTNQATPVGMLEQERSKVDATSLDCDGNWQHKFTSPASMESKRNSTAIGTATVFVDSGVGPQNMGKPVGLLESSTKRYKMMQMHSNCKQPTDDPKQDSGEVTAREYSRAILPRGEKVNTVCKYPAQVDQCCKLQDGVPVPLAAKMYYSHRNTRLRLALTHMFHENSKDVSGDMMGSQSPIEGMNVAQASSLNSAPSAKVDRRRRLLEMEKNSSAVKHNYQMVSQNREACLVRSGEHLPITNSSNQLPVEIAGSMPQAGGFGLTRSKYVAKPYSFVGSTGQLLGSIQQQTGSVPVV